MKERLEKAFYTYYGNNAEYFFSAPGRTELGGNHTDHQHGKVLAAAINLEAGAAVRRNGEAVIRVYSDGYGLCRVDLADLKPKNEERGTTAALIRGVAAAFAEEAPVPGFDAYVVSEVLQGSGLSSSAAFEVLIGTIINELGSYGKSAPKIARISQYAENEFFGKPCGLMDQTACAVGGFIFIDFNDPDNPVIEPIDFDFGKSGYKLCIIDCGADHADLTDEYAAITTELKQVCRALGKEYLRDVDEAAFYAALPSLRKSCGDRAVLRAIHIFEENKRADKEKAALEKGDFEEFLQLSRLSGLSSWRFLQNISPCGFKEHQDMALALALTETLLQGKGACRVQGGGFAGTLQAFVPEEETEAFKEKIEALIGEGCCHILSIRKEGSGLLKD